MAKGRLVEPALMLPSWGIRVVGRSLFSTIGNGTIAANADAATVSDPRATANSYVGVQLANDPGRKAAIQWVARGAGSFTVHLTERAQVATSFTYFIADPT